VTKELNPCGIEIFDPTKRTLLCPKRGNDPFATLAETYWILAGRNDVAFLLPFMPRAADFSDDGIVWRAGYGPRINHWGNGIQNVDVNQLEYVMKQLTKDPSCRQAVVSLWDPAKEDTVEKTKDFPCCNWIHFMIRENALNLNLVMRSNDAFWGWSHINMYEWSVIQEVVAKCLRVKIGTYYQMSDSFHMYEHSFERAKSVVDNAIWFGQFDPMPQFEFMNKALINEDAIKQYREYKDQVMFLCEDVVVGVNGSVDGNYCGYKDLRDAFKLLNMYKKYRQMEKGSWPYYKEVMETIPYSDLKVACHYWYTKNVLKVKDAGMSTIAQCMEECKHCINIE
jgi:hypothetical protein